MNGRTIPFCNVHQPNRSAGWPSIPGRPKRWFPSGGRADVLPAIAAALLFLCQQSLCPANNNAYPDQRQTQASDQSAIQSGLQSAASVKTAPIDDRGLSLVDDLGGSNRLRRQRATVELWNNEDQFADIVRAATKSDDAEIARRARWILLGWDFGITPGSPESVVRLIQREMASGTPAKPDRLVSTLIRQGEIKMATFGLRRLAPTFATRQTVGARFLTEIRSNIALFAEPKQQVQMDGLLDEIAVLDSLVVLRLHRMRQRGVPISNENLLVDAFNENASKERVVNTRVMAWEWLGDVDQAVATARDADRQDLVQQLYFLNHLWEPLLNDSLQMLGIDASVDTQQWDLRNFEEVLASPALTTQSCNALFAAEMLGRDEIATVLRRTITLNDPLVGAAEDLQAIRDSLDGTAIRLAAGTLICCGYIDQAARLVNDPNSRLMNIVLQRSGRYDLLAENLRRAEAFEDWEFDDDDLNIDVAPDDFIQRVLISCRATSNRLPRRFGVQPTDQPQSIYPSTAMGQWFDLMWSLGYHRPVRQLQLGLASIEGTMKGFQQSRYPYRDSIADEATSRDQLHYRYDLLRMRNDGDAGTSRERIDAAALASIIGDIDAFDGRGSSEKTLLFNQFASLLREAMQRENPDVSLADAIRAGLQLFDDEQPLPASVSKDHLRFVFQSLWDNKGKKTLPQENRIRRLGILSPTSSFSLRLQMETLNVFRRHGLENEYKQGLRQLIDDNDDDAKIQIADDALLAGRLDEALDAYERCMQGPRVGSALDLRRFSPQKFSFSPSLLKTRALVGLYAIAKRRGDRQEQSRIGDQLRVLFLTGTIGNDAKDLCNRMQDFSLGELRKLCLDDLKSSLGQIVFSPISQVYLVGSDLLFNLLESDPAFALRFCDAIILRTLDTDPPTSGNNRSDMLERQSASLLAYAQYGPLRTTSMVRVAVENEDERSLRAATRQSVRAVSVSIDVADDGVERMREKGMDAIADETIRMVFEKGKVHLSRFPLDAATANNLAWVCALSDHELETVLEYSRTAVDQFPDSVIYRDTLAEVLFRLGRVREAILIEKGCLLDTPGDWHLHKQINRFEQELNANSK